MIHFGFLITFQIDYAKSNIDTANQAIRTRVEGTQNTLWTTWNDWTTEEGEGQGENVGDENVDEKVNKIKMYILLRLVFEPY